MSAYRMHYIFDSSWIKKKKVSLKSCRVLSSGTFSSCDWDSGKKSPGQHKIHLLLTSRPPPGRRQGWGHRGPPLAGLCHGPLCYHWGMSGARPRMRALPALTGMAPFGKPKQGMKIQWRKTPQGGQTMKSPSSPKHQTKETPIRR